MSRARTTKKSAPQKSAAPTIIDITVASRAWTRSLRGAKAVCRRAASAALGKPGKPVELSILLTSDRASRKLNALYRGKDKPTNVLSFPAGDPLMLGDIAVAYGVTAREAKTERKTLTAHLSHLVVHGVLHLLGYDHENEKDAVAMERRERKILADLGIADPYAPAASAAARRRR
ncbi:MAG: rRNA maturation RNase YbeY [Rhodospirillaceae bacterium]|nr:rRNA maturation RNase YbeY [Rhodospirillaceae bacterium]